MSLDSPESIADQTLQLHWFGLCDSSSPKDKAFVLGMIYMAEETNIFNKEKAELWERRIATCPGHEGGGRVWCAYCGDIKPDEDEG